MFTSAFATNLTDVFNEQMETAVGIDREGTSNQFYKYVKFSGTTAVAAGDAVCYVLSDTTFGTVDDANTGQAAGIAMAPVPSGAVAWGWIQIKGLATVSWTVPGAVGDGLTSLGASAPALAVVSALGQGSVAYVANIANKQIFCDFPF